jgi:hypothetical protein
MLSYIFNTNINLVQCNNRKKNIAAERGHVSSIYKPNYLIYIYIYTYIHIYMVVGFFFIDI